ncbi:Peptidase C19 ubiquitin carboxyl-terminal hydrolase 2 [Penicillium herquei]|nr:Peptidase C19 ubiquitin carboxyl-terminal hydrolase 2 [Penicillium herquei]
MATGFIQKAGKTAPRLAEDIQLYDSVSLASTGRNLLSQAPPVFQEHYKGPLQYISSQACHHNYVIKQDQTHLARSEKARRGGMSKVVANYGNNTNTSMNEPWDHIHHLVYKSGRQKNSGTNEEIMQTGQSAETFHYQCSHPSCSTTVSLRILSPIITLVHHSQLTNLEILRQRAGAAFAAQPERLEGVPFPSPITVLENLRLYLNNALHHPDRSKAITSNNKRFMVSFGVGGEPCRELLEFLGFEYKKDDDAWEPPRPDPKATIPYQDTTSIFLDDVIYELICLIHNRPPSERREIHPPPLPPSANDDILHAMEAFDYPKSKRVREFKMSSSPCYEDLGAVEDMSSPLIIDSYQRQVEVDPENATRYLACLKEIVTLRGGEDGEIINQAVQQAYSEGRYTYDDVIEAYGFFGLHYGDQKVSDETIIEKFYALISASASDIHHQRDPAPSPSTPSPNTNLDSDIRRHLWLIGDSMGSQRIKAASEDRVVTFSQALAFLGVDEQTPDDFIVTMYTTKISDQPSSKPLAIKALELIAQARKSEGLEWFIKTGEPVSGDMDIADAYRMLQIPNRTVDEDAVIAAYTICVDENPGQADVYGRALGVIAKEMDSAVLKNMMGISTGADVNASDWPVGLTNIGNTCYLNSLLQFYFTIKPFRDLVGNIDKYQMDVTSETSLVAKKVGSRLVTVKEVNRSLRFVYELRFLFANMATSPNPSVAPSQELARLTLIAEGNEAAINRRSMTSTSKDHGLGDVDGAPVLGPLGDPQSIGEKPMTTQTNAKDAGSEATLVSQPEGPNSATAIQAVATSSDRSDQPPPVPSRPELDSREFSLENVDFGMQQDVTEVINNVLFQTQCAIRPREIASDGEQIDQVKDLFYGQTRSYLTTPEGTRSKEERWSDIKVNVALGPRDIYDAIDGAFDPQSIIVDKQEAEQHGAITRPPPVLQIQVQRVQFDPVKKTSYKSTNHLQLAETIYLDRYMDSSRPEILQKRQDCWEWKKRIVALQTRRNELLSSENSKTIDTMKLLSRMDELVHQLSGHQQNDSTHLCIEPTFSQEIQEIASVVEKEIQAIDDEVQTTKKLIAEQFADSRALPYELYAVFIHRGSVSFGHYWIYIHDLQSGIWRKYNDEYVTKVENLDEIFGNPDDTNPPTPYFLVYIHKDKKDILTGPLERSILEHSTTNYSNDSNVMEGIISPNPLEGAHADYKTYYERPVTPLTMEPRSPQ